MRLFKPSRARSVIVLPAFLIFMCYGAVIAQQPIADSLWVVLDDDSTGVARINSSGQIFPAESFVAGLYYQMYADTNGTCETDYHITAFRINGHRWRLRNWKGWRTLNVESDLLSYNSRTVETTLRAGDTLSFFRELRWKDPATSIQDTNNYMSSDTLTYSVELVRTSDHERAVLLDSLGVMPRTTPGAPVVFGMRPILATVKWVVPASLDGIEAFIRVRVRAKGSGEYHFTRIEKPTRMHEGPMVPYWADYLNYFSQVYATKPAVGSSEQERESSLLRLLPVSGTSDAVTMEFTTAPDGGATSLAIYDGTGRLVFYPYSAPSSSGGTERVSYRFESSGLYVACLIHAGRLVASRTITVGR